MSRLTQQGLAAFTGSLIRQRHWLGGVVYSEGVRHVAEAGGAHWLIDAIVLGMGSRKMKAAQRADPRLREMQFWSLERDSEGRSAVLRCEPWPLLRERQNRVLPRNDLHPLHQDGAERRV